MCVCVMLCVCVLSVVHPPTHLHVVGLALVVQLPQLRHGVISLCVCVVCVCACVCTNKYRHTHIHLLTLASNGRFAISPDCFMRSTMPSGGRSSHTMSPLCKNGRFSFRCMTPPPVLTTVCT